MKMERIKISLVYFITAAIVFCGCSDIEEDFLEIRNRNALSDNAFFKTQSQAEQAIFAVYSAIQRANRSGLEANTGLLSAVVTKSGPNANGDKSSYFDHTVTSTNSRLSGQWEDNFRVVFRANQVIANVATMPDSQFSRVNRKKEILGEGYFARALAMFWTYNAFNGGDNIPYPIAPATNFDNSFPKPQSRSFVLNQLISDAKIAQENLIDRLSWEPNTDDTVDNRGRATWGAATMLLAKIYLYENRIPEAIAEFEKLVDQNLGGYELANGVDPNDPNSIVNNFTELGEHNVESIFEVPFFTVGPRDGNIFAQGGEAPGASTEATLRDRSLPRNGFSSALPTIFISTLYRNDVLDPNADINQDLVKETVNINLNLGGNQGERTFETDVARNYSFRAQASISSIAFSDVTFNTPMRNLTSTPCQCAQRKFLNDNLDAPQLNSSINLKLMRFADAILLYAEALLKQDVPNIPKAVELINRVRLRSGLVDLETLFAGVTPPIAFSSLINENVTGTNIQNAVLNRVTPTVAEVEAFVDTMPDNLKYEPKPLTAENILEHLFDHERILEFAFEGHGINYFDLIRRPGGPQSFYQKYVNTASFYETFLPLRSANIARVGVADFADVVDNVNSPEDLFLPIPASELINNPNYNTGN